MLRRALLLSAVLAVPALTAPQAASAQTCLIPKAWQTAGAQLEYDLSVELLLTQQHTEHLMAQPSTGLPGAAWTYAGQRVVSSGYVAAAAARFATTVATASPGCARKRAR